MPCNRSEFIPGYKQGSLHCDITQHGSVSDSVTASFRVSEVDFWVQRAAHNLLDIIPEPKFDWISPLDLDSADDDCIGEEFDSVPDWLGSTQTVLPWLPVSCADVHSEMLVFDSWNGKEMMSQVRENMEEDHREVVDNIDHTINVALQPDDHEIAAKIRAQITSFESPSEVLTLCDEIQKLGLEKGRDSFRFWDLIEPWNADDETAAVLISNTRPKQRRI